MPLLRAALPLAFVVLVAFVAYANAWSDALVLDDKLFRDHERFAELSRLPEYFHESVWESADISAPLYRPLLMVSVAFNAAVFSDDFGAWRGTNVALHALVSLLVCLLLKQLLLRSGSERDVAASLAMLAALVFAVHPVHAEVVNSIFNRSALIAAIGCVGGLWWLLRFVDTRPVLAWTGIWLAYWVALFGRETGIVLPALTAILLWLYSDGSTRYKVKRCLPVLFMLLPAAIYLVLRAQAIATLPPPGEEITLESGVAGKLVGSGRLFEWIAIRAAAGAWLDSLRLALWPHPQMVFHNPLPEALQTTSLFVHLALASAAFYLWRWGRPGLLAGLALFYIALLPSSQLIVSDGELAFTAERFLYLASVGLTALLAFGLRLLFQRGDRMLAAAPVVLALFLLTPLTWARNTDWANEVRLLEHDYHHGVRSTWLLRKLTAAHVLQQNPAGVVELCSAHADVAERDGVLADRCGVAWAQTGNPDRAERAFLHATQRSDATAHARSNLAMFYLSQGRRGEARAQFERAVEAEENAANRAYLRGLMWLQLYPGDRERLLEAQAYFEEALRLQPGRRLATSRLQQVEARLAALEREEP